jgi:sugar/nucleoside kinase (ribokinase family)
VRLNQRPLSRNLAEPILLVVVIHVDGPRLNRVVLVHTLEQSIKVRHGFETEPRRLVGVHLADHVLREMRDVGIDTRFVEVVDGKPTLFSVCFQYPDGSGGNITTGNSAAAELSKESIDRAASLFQSFGPKTIALLVPEVPLATRRHFLGLAKLKGAFTAASFVSGEIAEAKLGGMFDLLNLVALNEEEAADFTGETFPNEKPQGFLDALCRLVALRYPQLSVVVSVGKSGAYFAHRSGWSYSPAPNVQVASTAGAGDCLLGGILAALAAGIPASGGQRSAADTPVLENAVDFGVLLATYKVSSQHTIHPTASLDELLQFAKCLGIEPGADIHSRVAAFEGVRPNR